MNWVFIYILSCFKFSFERAVRRFKRSWESVTSKTDFPVMSIYGQISQVWTTTLFYREDKGISCIVSGLIPCSRGGAGCSGRTCSWWWTVRRRWWTAWGCSADTPPVPGCPAMDTMAAICLSFFVRCQYNIPESDPPHFFRIRTLHLITLATARR